MAQRCSLCRSPRRAEIDEALLAGTSCRDVAGRFGTSKSAVDRHRPHIPRALAWAAARAEDVRAESVLDKVRGLEADARRIARQAEAEGDTRAAMAGVKLLLDVVAKLGDLAAAAREEEVEPLLDDEQLAAEVRRILGGEP